MITLEKQQTENLETEMSENDVADMGQKKQASPELVEKVTKYLETSGVNQVTLAKRLNKSETTISLYLKGKYKGDIKSLETDLKKYFKVESARKNHKKLKLNFEKTSVASKILEIAAMCQFNGEMALCYGASGLGKTTALEYLKKEGSGIVLIDPDENATPRAILKQVADGIKLGYYDILPEEFIANIVKKLKKSEYLIVVDEAENLKADVFRTLRKIHDRCNGTCGMLFIGTERLYGNLAKRRGEFDYVLTRVSLKYQLKPLTLEDVSLLVKQIFPDASDEIIRSFSVHTGNNARILFNTLRRSHNIVENNKVDLNEDVIREARGLLF